MPPALPSNTPAATVRAHFGLSQAELAGFLGVSREQLAYVEAGQRGLLPEAERRLRRLVRLLSATEVPVLPAVAVAPANPAPLRKRLRRCRHLAAQVRYELETRAIRQQTLTHRQQGLAQLHAGLLAVPPDPAADPARELSWLAQLPTPPTATGAMVTAQALLTARLRGLLAEAAALEETLAALPADGNGGLYK